jgi:hypothetical protein
MTLNVTSSYGFTPSSAWLKSQADRTALEMFLSDYYLPAKEAGAPCSDIDNIAEATKFFLSCGVKEFLMGNRISVLGDYYASLARIACELAEEIANQLEVTNSWVSCATMAISAIVEPVLGGYSASQIAHEAISAFKHSRSLNAKGRTASLLARRAWAAIQEDSDEVAMVSSVAQLIALELSRRERVAA